MLLEDDRLDVRQVHHRVDDRELEIRELLGDLLHAGRLGEADAHGDLGAAAGHVAQRLLPLGLVRDLELAIAIPVSFLKRSAPL